MTDLVKRLRDTASKGVSVWGDLQMEAAKEIEILTAEREAYASSMGRMQARVNAEKEAIARYGHTERAEAFVEGWKAAQAAPTKAGCTNQPPGPPGREFKTTLFSGHTETKKSIQNRRDYEKFMRGYKFALGHPNVPQPGEYV